MDLVFPHHENEIAQSEAAHPHEGDFCHTWIHNGFINVDKEKMAKSLGNFVTIRDVLRAQRPEALRYFLLSAHYRGPIAFDTVKQDDGRVVFPGVIEAERRVDYLYGALSRAAELRHAAGESQPSPMPRELAAAAALASSGEASLAAALDDDLNTPVALSVLAELAKAANELCDLFDKRKKDEKLRRAAASVGTQLAVTLRACLDRLGLLQTPVDDYTARTRAQRLRIRGLTAEAVEDTLRARDEARKARDFAKSDELRQALSAQGIELADTPSGTTWRVAVM
jgi:cysteinyl-tRNA synthetase